MIASQLDFFVTSIKRQFEDSLAQETQGNDFGHGDIIKVYASADGLEFSKSSAAAA